MLEKSSSVTTDPNTVENESNLIDLLMRIELTREIDHPFSHVLIFGNMFPESHGFDAVQVTG